MRDFGQVFDAYAQFEESMINAKMETTAEMGPTEEGMGGVCVSLGICICFVDNTCSPRYFSGSIREYEFHLTTLYLYYACVTLVKDVTFTNAVCVASMLSYVYIYMYVCIYVCI